MSVFKPYSCKIVAMPVLFDVELSLMNVFRWTCCLSFRTVCCRRCYTCSDALQDAFNNPVSCECHIVVAVEDTKLLFAIAKDAVVPDKGGEISLSGLADQYLAVVAHVLVDEFLSVCSCPVVGDTPFANDNAQSLLPPCIRYLLEIVYQSLFVVA